MKPSKPESNEENKNDDGTMRLNRYVAHCGIAARRKCDEFIKQGLVKVNGKTILEPGFRVKDSDKISYKGKKIKPVQNMVYILMNKPKNVITTTDDEKGRKTVMDIVKSKVKERIYPVGRLDRNTTGLLLLTNDGDLAKKLSHPSYEIKKIYHAQLDKIVTLEHLSQIRKGLKLEDGLAPVDKVSHLKGKEKNLVGIEIHIGRNRIVRRIFESLGYVVVKLDRVYYAGLTKKDLPRGWFRELDEKEVILVKHFN